MTFQTKKRKKKKKEIFPKNFTTIFSTIDTYIGNHFLIRSHTYSFRRNQQNIFDKKFVSTDFRAPTHADPANALQMRKLHFRLHEKFPKAR